MKGAFFATGNRKQTNADRTIIACEDSDHGWYAGAAELAAGQVGHALFQKSVADGLWKVIVVTFHHVFQPLSTQARRYKYFAKSARDAAQNAPGLQGWTFDIIWRS
jgi:hypothetical protein